MIVTVLALMYVGTRTVSVGGPLVVYTTMTQETQTRLARGRLVVDTTSFTIVTPPPPEAKLFPELLDTPIDERVERTIDGTGAAEFVTHERRTTRSRNFYGAGRPGYGTVTTFETSYARDSVARVELETSEDSALEDPIERPSLSTDALGPVRTVTTIAADGSYERVRTPEMQNGFAESVKPDGTYAYISNVPGFSSVERRFTPQVTDSVLTGIAFHQRLRGRTIGVVPYRTTDGIASVWFDEAAMPRPFERRTIVRTALVDLPSECTLPAGDSSREQIASKLDTRHTIDMRGSIDDAIATTYYKSGRPMCTIAERKSRRFDVITATSKSSFSQRDIRILVPPQTR